VDKVKFRCLQGRDFQRYQAAKMRCSSLFFLMFLELLLGTSFYVILKLIDTHDSFFHDLFGDSSSALVVLHIFSRREVAPRQWSGEERMTLPCIGCKLLWRFFATNPAVALFLDLVRMSVLQRLSAFSS
jgi:hypothetical protein